MGNNLHRVKHFRLQYFQQRKQGSARASISASVIPKKACRLSPIIAGLTTFILFLKQSSESNMQIDRGVWTTSSPIAFHRSPSGVVFENCVKFFNDETIRLGSSNLSSIYRLIPSRQVFSIGLAPFRQVLPLIVAFRTLSVGSLE